MLKFTRILSLFVISLILMRVQESFGAMTLTYTYDNLHRLTRVERSNGSYVAYSYDEVGNRTSISSDVPPGAPTIETVSVGDAQATITFTAPSSNGGSAITSYTVTANPGDITATGSESPIVITGLTNGTIYTFTITATNSVGKSVASVASNEVTPMGIQDITFGIAPDVISAWS